MLHLTTTTTAAGESSSCLIFGSCLPALLALSVCLYFISVSMLKSFIQLRAFFSHCLLFLLHGANSKHTFTNHSLSSYIHMCSKNVSTLACACHGSIPSILAHIVLRGPYDSNLVASRGSRAQLEFMSEWKKTLQFIGRKQHDAA